MLSYTIEGEQINGVPYMPTDNDGMYWTLDSGNNWKLKFSEHDSTLFEIYHRYQCPEKGNDMVERLVKWLEYRITGLQIVEPESLTAERTKLASLISSGYVVLVVDPFATQFGSKYEVFTDKALTKKVVINMHGDLVATQK